MMRPVLRTRSSGTLVAVGGTGTDSRSVSGGRSFLPAVEGMRHCGLCSKCRERHDAFLEAGVSDPTDYRDTQFVRA